jgi:hypothetical protein
MTDGGKPNLRFWGIVIAVVVALVPVAFFMVSRLVTHPGSNFWPTVTSVTIATLTAALVGTTILYVVVTQQLVKQTAENAELVVRMAVPVLNVLDGPELRPEDPADYPGHWTVVVGVRNVGNGVATDLVMYSDWPVPIPFDKSVGSREDRVQVVHERPRLPEGIEHIREQSGRPHPTAWEFTDLSGTRYRQPVGGRPQVI